MPVAPGGDAVSTYLQSGKPLPSYISDSDASSSVAPITVAPSEAPTQVATVDPAQVVAPVPFPGRPPQLDVQPRTDVLPPATDTATASVPYVTPPPAAPVLDESSYQQDQQTADAPTGPVPPEPINDNSTTDQNGDLQQYLDRNGLSDNGSGGDSGRSTAQVTVTDPGNSNYDPQGFYLSDGPNNAREAARRRRIERLLDGGDAPDFTLF